MALIKVPRVLELARLLEEDIRTQRLAAGDQYLNAAAAARKLRVSTSTANRALQLLSQRGIVDRTQRRGTFVSEVSPETSLSTIRRVQMIRYQHREQLGRIAMDSVMLGLQKRLPHALIQFNLVPATDEQRHLDHLVQESADADDPIGIVLTLAPFYAQKKVQQSGLPAVIHGEPHASIDLASVNADHQAMGRLVAEHAIAEEVARVAYLPHDRTLLQGDVQLLEGLLEVLAAAGKPLGFLRLQPLPDDPEGVRTWVGLHCARFDEKALFLVYSDRMARAVCAALAGDGIGPQAASSAVVVQAADGDDSMPRQWARLSCKVSSEDAGECIGAMLAAQACGDKLGERQVKMPVELLNP